MAKDDKPQTKEFGLKDIDLQMINTINGLAQTSMSNFASFVLMDRFAYQVTGNSKFEIDFEKKSIKVWEEEQRVEPAPEQSAAKAIGDKDASAPINS